MENYLQVTFSFKAEKEEIPLNNIVPETVKNGTIKGYKFHRKEPNMTMYATDKQQIVNDEIFLNTIFTLNADGMDVIKKQPIRDTVEKAESRYFPCDIKGESIDFTATFVKMLHPNLVDAEQSFQMTIFYTLNKTC